jgi:SAM-dependent methyltransferase
MDPETWDERYRATDRLWSEGPNMFVADRLGPAEPGVGIDVASGEGRNAIWLAERGWDMTAVDFSEVAVERGRSASDKVDFVVADILSWEPDKTFDLALIAYLHLPPCQMREAVRRVVGWLNPGGELFLIGHDVSNLEDGHGGPQVPEILNEVEAILEWIEGMDVIEAQVVRRPVETDEGVVYARDTLVRARAVDSG